MLRAAGFQLRHGAEYTAQMGVGRHQLPRWELRVPKSHLLRGLPDITGCPNSVSLVSDGGLPHQKTAKAGAGLSVRIVDDDCIELAREVTRSGRIFITRNGIKRPLLPPRVFSAV